MRLLGVTATPYRYHYGNIYGKEDSWFSELDHEIPMEQLIELNYLVDLRIKITTDESIIEDLSKTKTQHGDFIIHDLSQLMCKSVHISSIVDAYQIHGEDRKYVCVFTVTIEHAEKVTDALREAGYTAAYIHSKMTRGERRQILKGFEAGIIQFIVSVGVLTEGWDAPKIELIIMARPTLSAGLYVQMIGRGTRIAPNKKNLLILDLVNNYKLHGNPKYPTIKDYTKPEYEKGPQPLICPRCQIVVLEDKSKRNPDEVLVCPECGFEFEKPEPKQELIDRPLDQMIEIGQYFPTFIRTWQLMPYKSYKGNYMLKLVITHNKGEPINYFIDIEGNASGYGYEKAQKWWKRYSCKPTPPANIDAAMERQNELILPEQIDIRRDGKWWKIRGW
jgi:DNA repair protein RadD